MRCLTFLENGPFANIFCLLIQKEIASVSSQRETTAACHHIATGRQLVRPNS